MRAVTLQIIHNEQISKHLFLYLDISQVCSLRALPQPEQELALERHAISHSCSWRFAFVAKETLAPVAVSRYGKSETYSIF